QANMVSAEKKIICLSGLGGSGKTTLVKHAIKNWGMTPYFPADLLRSFDPDFTHADRTASRNTLQRMRTALGANIILRSILELPAQRICLDGPRCLYDLELLQES